MKYVKLIDYLDRPEMIRHVEGVDVLKLYHFPAEHSINRVLVEWADGTIDLYTEEGSRLESGPQMFVLKWETKPKRTITGWRRGVLYPDGSFDKNEVFRPSKGDFIAEHPGFTLFGPWESETIEIEED